jgi:hypothetical protein
MVRHVRRTECHSWTLTGLTFVICRNDLPRELESILADRASSVVTVSLGEKDAFYCRYISRLDGCSHTGPCITRSTHYLPSPPLTSCCSYGESAVESLLPLVELVRRPAGAAAHRLRSRRRLLLPVVGTSRMGEPPTATGRAAERAAGIARDRDTSSIPRHW